MCYSNYAFTKDPGSKKGALPPIRAKASPHLVFTELNNYFKTNNYNEFASREEYYDLFFKIDNFEISLNILPDENKSLICLSVYSEKKSLKTKKTLYRIYELVEKILERYR